MRRLIAACLLLGACSDDSSGDVGVCTPGETQICVGAGRCDGAQACLPNGMGYGPCECGTPVDASMSVDSAVEGDAAEPADAVADVVESSDGSLTLDSAMADSSIADASVDPLDGASSDASSDSAVNADAAAMDSDIGDSATVDSGPSDSGSSDTGSVDTGMTDAGLTDSAVDGNTSDASASDGSTDVGSPLDQCLAEATTPLAVCECNMCLMLRNDCLADDGCTAIRDCANESGCRGLDCYGLSMPGPCRDVIDANGGIVGMSTQRASALSNCITTQCES